MFFELTLGPRSLRQARAISSSVAEKKFLQLVVIHEGVTRNEKEAPPRPCDEVVRVCRSNCGVVGTVLK